MPSRRLVLLAAPAAVAAFALAGCSLADDGPRTTQTRDVAAFTRIDNPSSVDLRLHIGEREGRDGGGGGEEDEAARGHGSTLGAGGPRRGGDRT